MITKHYELATLSFDPDKNILYYRVNQEQEIDVFEITEMLSYASEFMGNKRHMAVIDFGGNLSSTTEARKIYAEAPYIKTYRIADAFLVKSLATRIVANFFINVTKPAITTKLFTSEEEAVKWLEKIGSKQESEPVGS